MNIIKSHAILIHFHTLRIGILTSGIKYVNVKMGDYDLREILKELRQMMNEVSKKVKVFSKSHKAVKEFSKLKEDTKASTEKKRAIESSLQNVGPSGCVFLGRVFKNAAQNGIKPRFLKTGLKGARPSRVLYAGP